MVNYDEILTEVMRNSTIHGLNHMYSAKARKTKTLWFLFFLLGIGGFIFSLSAIINKYLQNPVLLNHFVDYEKFIWPDLTFCNPTAPFALKANSSTLKYWKETLKHTENLAKLLSNESGLFGRFNAFRSTRDELQERTLVLSTMNPAEIRANEFSNHVLLNGYSQGHSQIYLIKEYDTFASNLIDMNYTELFSTQFVQIRNNIPCHTFQLEKSKSIDYTSIRSLIFLINLDFESYKVFNSSYVARNSLLYVTPQNHLPQNDEIVILPGYTHKVIVSQSRHYRHEIKNSCRHVVYKVKLYDALLSSINEYEGNYEDCRKVLSQKLYVDNCHCYSPFLPIYKSSSGGFPRLCFNATIFSESEILTNTNCMLRVFEKYSKNSSFNRIEEAECGKYKSQKCLDLTYSTYQKSEFWLELGPDGVNDRMNEVMKHSFEKVFKRNSTGTDFLKEIQINLAALLIQRKSKYGDLFKEELEYSFSNFLSDAGGLMGLWLGLSVVGLFEILEIIFYFSLKAFVIFRNPTFFKIFPTFDMLPSLNTI